MRILRVAIAILALRVNGRRPSYLDCAICDFPDEARCLHYGLCDKDNACADKCPEVENLQAHRFRNFMDYRISKALGPKGAKIRITAITEEGAPPVANFYDHSARFVGKFSGLYLHTTVKNVSDGPFDIGTRTLIDVKMPKSSDGVAAVFVGDPCFRDVHSKIALVGCFFSSKYKTYENTPRLLNAFVPQMDFWSLMGDNWYDHSGYVTKLISLKFDDAVKNVPFVTVPGNHDFWYIGEPSWIEQFDQKGFGFVQYYGQDVMSAKNIAQGFPDPPYNLTPTAPHGLPGVENFFFYHQMGNLGIMGFSGAHDWSETKPLFEEACTWFRRQKGLRAVLMLGHWDVNNFGSPDNMDTPDVFHLLGHQTSCAPYITRRTLKFIMGHTHCNMPHPHGNVGDGFMVAGQGMVGCGNYGIPIFDTTENRLRFWYFPVTLDTVNVIIDCVTKRGWRQCTSFAELWLDQPLGESDVEEIRS